MQSLIDLFSRHCVPFLRAAKFEYDIGYRLVNFGWGHPLTPLFAPTPNLRLYKVLSLSEVIKRPQSLINVVNPSVTECAIIWDFFKRGNKADWERLKDAGPTGEPWPKKPKISARDLDSVNNPEQNKRKSLAGEELHKYLVENCAKFCFFLSRLHRFTGTKLLLIWLPA